MPVDLTQTLRRHCARSRTPGAVAAVVDADGLVGTGAAGAADIGSHEPAALHTTWHWFSMTKLVTVTAAMQLVDRGRLDLDAPVRDYLPGVLRPSFDGVRVRHLANHSSGLTNPPPIRWVHAADAPMPNQRDLVRRLVARQRRPRFEPGTQARYTNLGSLLLGEVIAEITGVPYAEHVERAILEPLGMASTCFEYSPVMLEHAATGYQRAPRGTRGILVRVLPRGVVGVRTGRFVAFRPFVLDGAAYGGLIGSVADAARFARLHLRGGELDGQRLLSAESARAMADVNLPGRPYDVGLGWFRRHRDTVAGRTHVEHLGGGGGFFDAMRLDPRRGVGVVVMTNTTRPFDVNGLTDELVEHSTTAGDDGT